MSELRRNGRHRHPFGDLHRGVAVPEVVRVAVRDPDWTHLRAEAVLPCLTRKRLPGSSTSPQARRRSSPTRIPVSSSTRSGSRCCLGTLVTIRSTSAAVGWSTIACSAHGSRTITVLEPVDRGPGDLLADRRIPGMAKYSLEHGPLQGAERGPVGAAVRLDRGNRGCGGGDVGGVYGTGNAHG